MRGHGSHGAEKGGEKMKGWDRHSVHVHMSLCCVVLCCLVWNCCHIIHVNVQCTCIVFTSINYI